MTFEHNIPVSLLETTLNTRDLGLYQSSLSGKKLQPWRILRSDVQHHPSERDVELLKSKNICTIIDMRGEKDAQKKPSGFFRREGFTYHNIPIDEGSGIPESVDLVSKAYMNIAESKNMPHIFRTISAACTGVMINCTAGKDRTGVFSAILLGVCGVSDEDIIYDYMLTKACSQARFDMIHQRFPDVDMNIAIPHESYMADFLHQLKAKYGSYQAYLVSVGLSGKEIEQLITKLI